MKTTVSFCKFLVSSYPAIILLFTVVTYSAGLVSGIEASPDLEKIYENVKRIKLAYQRQWLLLLHYEARLDGSYQSRVDGSKFFYSTKGVSEPEEELIANLKAFFSPIPQKHEDHAICKFPARFKWLKSKLNLRVPFSKQLNCDSYKKFFKKLQANSISIVFVSADMSESATLFGHTFLKFNKNKASAPEEDPTVSYVANIRSAKTSFEIIYKGLLGSFKGQLDIKNFDHRRWQYNFLENRSFWNLELNFSSEEIERLIDHLWEVNFTHIYYYFFDENCAFYNIYFLEAANPKLDITSNFFYLVIPVDTIRRLFSHENIIKSATFYPANIEEYKMAYDQLNKHEKEELRILIQDPQGDFSENTHSVRKDLVFSAAIYSLGNGVDRATGAFSEDKEKIYKNLLKVQAEHQTNLKSYAKPDYTNPSIGHGSSALLLNGGFGNEGPFLSLTYRPVFHDLLDSPLGYLPFTDLTVLSPKFRYYTEKRKLYLELFTFFRAIVLNPIEMGIFQSSWTVDLGIKSLHKEFLNTDHLAFYFNYGYGYSFRLRWIPRDFAFYALANIYSEASSYFSNSLRIAPSPRAGLIWYITYIFTLHTYVQYRYFLISNEVKENLIINNSMNITLSEYIALEVYYLNFLLRSQYEARFALKIYF